MTWPPAILRLRFENRRRRCSLWLPLCLLWPLAILLWVIALPFLLVGALVLWPWGWGRALLLAHLQICRLICALRGLRIEVNQGTDHILISFW
jgi:hypothetical protein